MIGNIVILAVMVGLAYFVFKVFRSNLRDKLIFNILAVFAAIFLVVVFLIPNIEFITKPFSPGEHYQLVDADTKQPIADANVLVVNYYECSIFMSLKRVVTSQRVIKTKEDGTFKIRMSPRYLSFHFPFTLAPLLTRQSGDRYFLIWKNGYQCRTQKIGNILMISKTKTRKDKLEEIRETQDRLEAGRYYYNKEIQGILEKHLKQLVSVTPVDLNKMYWLEP